MTLDEVEKWFGSFYKAFKILELNMANLSRWKRIGYIPLKQQYRIAQITEGELLPDDEDPTRYKYKKKNKEE